MSDRNAEHLVVVGSSAGGIEALGVLVSGLPENFPAPVVLAQHLDPNRPSHLPGILERRASIPVISVTSETELKPAHIYVVPSNRHVVIREGRVDLESDHGDRPRPSVDLLLSTAARSYGDKLIAVILTGSGSDGAEGAVEVKEAGGCVVIQNPRTAAHPSMPSALPPTAVDYIVDLEQIAPLLNDILHGTVIEKRIESVDRTALEEVLGMVTRHGGIDFHQYKATTILRRISRRMAVNHTHTLEEYRDYMASHPNEIGDLVRSLLIKVTEFFRDPEAFAYLEHDIVPRLIQHGRERGRVLRLWSAGCATGEEAYSLALLFAHILGRELPEWSIKIFATDVDSDAIAYARRGFYPPNVLKSLPPDYKSRFFEPADHGYRISKSLRQMIIFGQQDLSRGVPFPRVDLITCRNLLIYFKPDLQQAVLDLFAYSLQQTSGYLFLGKAETARPSRSVYEMVNKKWKIYRCVSGPIPIPARPPGDPGRLIEGQAVSNGLTPDIPAREQEVPREEDADLRRSNELLLRFLPIGICVIDRNYRIISINASARRLLGVRDHATGHDFLHTVRGFPYSDVRSAIDRAFRERTVAVLPQVEMDSSMGEARFITLQIVPNEGGQRVDSALVCIENVTELVQTQRRLEATQSEQNQLAQDLGSANQRLLEMNKDLQDANEELQAANEEMMLAQEELQATNEEFEATNEELQATNEELETNNEELQATNEELETTNEELQARTSELQELTHILSGERSRLSDIVEQAPFHILILRGPALVIESMNPPLKSLFEEGQVERRPFEEVATAPSLEPVRLAVRRSYVEGRPWHSDWIRIQDEDDERYLAFSVVPTHGAEGTDGVVVYVEDVTQRRIAEEAEKLGKLKMMLDHANQLAMALFDAKTGLLLHASQQYLGILSRVRDITPTEAFGKRWNQIWLADDSSARVFERVVREGRPERLHEVHVKTSDGSSVWDFNLIPITPDGGGPADYVVLTAVEVTRPVLAREALEQVDRLKDSFLSLASHELRTPLTPLAAYVELLAHLMDSPKRDGDWEQQVKDVIGRFRRQISYMSRLTEDLVDISRIRSGKLTLDLKRVDLRHVIEEAREQAMALSAGADIRLDLPQDGEISVQADEMRLIQVVYNFISNAVKHAPGSDHIVVTLRTKVVDGRKWGRVEVRDYGPGVPEQVRSDLFVRVMHPSSHESRTARSGMGLGLFISARIIEQHVGKIGIDAGKPGTKIWFELPVTVNEPARVESSAS